MFVVSVINGRWEGSGRFAYGGEPSPAGMAPTVMEKHLDYVRTKSPPAAWSGPDDGSQRDRATGGGFTTNNLRGEGSITCTAPEL